MQALIGNPAAIEKVLDRKTGKAMVRSMPGERITTFNFPDDMDIDEVFMNIVDALPSHMQREAKPAWIETDDINLTRKLCSRFSILLKDNKRPKDWGAGLAPYKGEHQA